MIGVNLDVMMAKRKIGLGELAEKIDLTPANLSILKNNKAKAVRFTTLNAICKALDCQPGDLLEWVEDFATQEGPRLVKDGGRLAITEVLGSAGRDIGGERGLGAVPGHHHPMPDRQQAVDEGPCVLGGRSMGGDHGAGMEHQVRPGAGQSRRASSSACPV